jgi:prepilin-type N-terminal cleavage/methylation domain-containing protein/prepilin-type processing-associated H-X9-DG protein
MGRHIRAKERELQKSLKKNPNLALRLLSWHTLCYFRDVMPGSKHGGFQEGFTLTESLVAVGIILVLGVVVLPSVGKVLNIRGDVTCLSNLRQIGLGILQYTEENNGVLPGPLQAMQFPWWSGAGPNGGDPTQLASYLQPYLALKKTRTKWDGTDVFVCPAYKSVKKGVGDSPAYALNIRVPMGEELTERPPFGYPCAIYPNTFKTNATMWPLRMVELPEIRGTNGSPAQASTWLMMDADQQNERFKNEPADLRSLPPYKVHRTHRNALFFDFHVARIDFGSDSQP